MKWLKFLIFLPFLIIGCVAIPATKIDNNYLEIIPNIVGTSGQFNLSWSFVKYDSNYPDCYLILFNNQHAQILRKIKIINPLGVNKTVSALKIAYTNLVSSGSYFINLNCEVLNGDKNKSCPGCSKNLDVAPIYVNIKTNDISNYVNCKTIIGTNCLIWQKTVSDGFSWNRTIGVPI